VAAQKPIRTRAGKRAAKCGTAPEAGTPPQPVPERRYVDVDPWAMLLEGLMGVPEEEPAERTRPRKK